MTFELNDHPLGLVIDDRPIGLVFYEDLAPASGSSPEIPDSSTRAPATNTPAPVGPFSIESTGER